MSTATIATKCPEWCKLQARHIDDEGGHSGPSWQEVPSMAGRFDHGHYNWASVSTGSTAEGAMAVYIQAEGIEMTPEQALQLGRNLIEAAEWASAHGVA